MMIINRKIANQLAAGNKYAFAGLPFGKKREKTKNDLPKYDVVIAGGHLGALLSNHLDAVVGSKASIFVAYDTLIYELATIRPFYERGLFTKFKAQGDSKKTMSKFAAHSEGQGVAQFLPNQNAVVLKNGRKIQYEQLVIATGLKPERSVKGLDEAWVDANHPFFMSADHPTWRTTSTKSYRFLNNFLGGEGIFYIPPFPFHTQVENYNFLLAKSLWDRGESFAKFTWDNSRLTVINANDSFCQFYERGDSFIKSELERKKINVEYGLKLVEIKKDTQTAVFQNVKTGQLTERPYNSLYSLQEAKPDQIISNAGLGDSQGFVDVDPHTLQHKKYSNVFALGDVANLPTSKTFWAGFNQLHVVRNNLERQLNGLSLNAKYDGTSQALLQVEEGKSVTLSHSYGGKPNDSLDTGFLASLRYTWAEKNKGSIGGLMTFKNWGPPYYKFKKTFEDSGSATKSAVELHPEKKQA